MQATKRLAFLQIQRENLRTQQDLNNLLVEVDQAQAEALQVTREYIVALKESLQSRSEDSFSKQKQKEREVTQKEMVYTLKQADIANLYRSWLDSQPEEFLNSIESIALKKNHLIPSELKQYLLKMKNLKVIDLTEAPVTSIARVPKWLSEISSIQEIRLKGNHQLDETGIPQSILDMPNVKVIADFTKIPWSYPRHKLSSVIDTIKNLPWVVKLVNLMMDLTHNSFIFKVLTIAATCISIFCPLVPFLVFMYNSLLLKGFGLICVTLISILNGGFISSLLFRMDIADARMEIADTEIEKASLTLHKIVKLSLTVLGIMGLAYGLTYLLPSILPQLANLTGYASKDLYNALSLSAYTIALIPSYYAVYTTYRDIWNQFAPRE